MYITRLSANFCLTSLKSTSPCLFLEYYRNVNQQWVSLSLEGIFIKNVVISQLVKVAKDLSKTRGLGN